MNKVALHFGAGNIGRGFIAPVLQENDYEVVFVDVDKDLINKINTLKKYKVNFIGSNNQYIDISNIKALNISDTDKIQSLISSCEIISTSVGPQYVKNVIDAISNVRIDKQVSFIAFENKYRASTSAKEESEFHNENVKFVDVVIDKIVPLQSKESLDVNVEKYGSIVFDNNRTTPLNFSSVVRDGDYDYEFKKKLWMLNGLHLCLAYFGISENYQYIHELYENKETHSFINLISSEIMESVQILQKEEHENLEKYKNIINDRFANNKINDQLLRVARNPIIKFSYLERFHEPLDLLIQDDKNISGFKKILDLIFDYPYEGIDSFNEFKNGVLNLGRENLYKNFWKQDKNYNNYLEKLGE